jgi:hypothetical protein
MKIFQFFRSTLGRPEVAHHTALRAIEPGVKILMPSTVSLPQSIGVILRTIDYIRASERLIPMGCIHEALFKSQVRNIVAVGIKI